ncbi:hypothetical protein Ptr902_09815 [Pyrenophora tritici-repentis]|uniref:FAP multi-domain protein n=2 Tax=Pyrenophora tritici-repentis TaxID=45151 RepID=A0A2W1G5P8_9PLEO|nr:uncharacterized protein PTRG_06920 [Pyrenophora tritici-repentis Pt-1C-BFP]KAA8614466.1 hypothetical protein PtrV1_11496 [Pyrenophora tritici-repentis]EDU49840.1 conserved hypothetical protein [Pyrenophora tritici-repentis Pt-1C-BFP]KAF7444298.1 hypothetical protein A1F99_108510 [Pyrenophora tritici-repentis]KAF7565053.1 FAP multi-domain protein [Pyrenophora tritici-repentis]KAI0580873.1 hypothetical protein Alg215_04975 [Pyrenophora tritici-repentis]
MSKPTYLLFPNLPPELRQEIYTYLSTPDNTSTPAQTTSLPLVLKTYTCKHTTIQILPVHHGSAGLLSLPHDIFPEAAEYRTWLLSNAVELCIGVQFTGRVNSFVQADWDRKVETHLNKLVKQHAWLRKVSRYDVKVYWMPKDGPLKSKKGKRVAGRIPNAMVESLTKMMDEGVKRRKGEVRVALVTGVVFVFVSVAQSVRFGLDVFLARGNGGAGFKRVVKEVHNPRVGAHVTDSSFLVSKEKEFVEWVDGTWDQLVMRKTYVDGDEGEAVVTYGQKQPGYSFTHTLMECMGQD